MDAKINVTGCNTLLVLYNITSSTGRSPQHQHYIHSFIHSFIHMINTIYIYINIYLYIEAIRQAQNENNIGAAAEGP